MSLAWAIRRQASGGLFIAEQRFGSIGPAYDDSQGYADENTNPSLDTTGTGTPWNTRQIWGSSVIRLDSHGYGFHQVADMNPSTGSQSGIWKTAIGNPDMHFKMLVMPDGAANTSVYRNKVGGLLRASGDGSSASSFYALTYDVQSGAVNTRHVSLHLSENDGEPTLLHESADIVGMTRSGGQTVAADSARPFWLLGSIVKSIASYELRDTDDSYVITSGTFDTTGDPTTLTAGTHGGVFLGRRDDHGTSQPILTNWSAGPGHWE